MWILEGKLPIKVLTHWHNKEIDESDEESENVSVISGGSSKSSNQRFKSLFKFLLRERKNAEKMLLLKNSGSKTPSESQGRHKDINGHISGGKGGSGNVGGGNSGGSGGCVIHPSNSCLIHPNSSRNSGQ